MLNNAQIAEKLTGLAQLLAVDARDRYKVKAYRRAARTIQTLGESVDEMVRNDADLTGYPGIGKAISGALREVVQTGTLRQMEALRERLESGEIAARMGVRMDRHVRQAPSSGPTGYCSTMRIVWPQVWRVFCWNGAALSGLRPRAIFGAGWKWSGTFRS